MNLGLNAQGWLSTLCCWEAAIHTLAKSWKKINIKMMMMMIIISSPQICLNIFNNLFQIVLLVSQYWHNQQNLGIRILTLYYPKVMGNFTVSE